MDDSFNTYINQFLIDPLSAEANSEDSNSNAGMDVDKASALGSDLFLQLLLNSVSSPGDATVDPNSLSSFQINSADPLYATATDATSGGVADPNSLLTDAFLSALGPLPYPESSVVPESLVAPSAISSMHEGDEPMLVDTEETAKSETIVQDTATGPMARPAPQNKAKAPRPKPSNASNPQKKTIQQQALSAASAATIGKRASSTASGPTASAPKRAPVPGNTTAAAAAGNDESLDDESAIYAMTEGSDELDGIDLKSMSSKERRQLRNKISARNFRVRRKEYISNLEGEVRMHKEEADGLRSDLIASKKENQQLRDELQKLRQKFNAATISQASASPAAMRTTAASAPQKPLLQQAKGVAAKPVSSSPVATPTVTPAMPPAAPMVRFNPHKDIGQAAAKKSAAAGTAATTGSWAPKNSSSGYITVNTTMLPMSFSTKIDELAMETRRKQAVDALLDMGDDDAPEDTNAVAVPPVELVPAMLEAAAIIAELLLPQIALELSFAPPQTSPSTGSPCAAVQC
ncbi:hypothetical protein LPJ59_001293 [Coemansia sp. RSA 2399]|nr:hypothetical protein LPJ59_001293 [Coemansia sp. RSA 2399]KAJ1906606.1 hypothetical protein LPJ81_001259 [Coemansia sp. IMI 209127]